MRDSRHYQKVIDTLSEDDLETEARGSCHDHHSNLARLYLVQQTFEKMTDWEKMVVHAKRRSSTRPCRRNIASLIMADKSLKKAVRLREG